MIDEIEWNGCSVTVAMLNDSFTWDRDQQADNLTDCWSSLSTYRSGKHLEFSHTVILYSLEYTYAAVSTFHQSALCIFSKVWAAGSCWKLFKNHSGVHIHVWLFYFSHSLVLMRYSYNYFGTSTRLIKKHTKGHNWVFFPCLFQHWQTCAWMC